MDRLKFSDIAHRDHLIDSPITSEKLDEIVAILQCKDNDLVLDIGSGKGELLLRIAEKYHIVGKGIDISEERINEGKKKALRRSLKGTVLFSVENGKNVIHDGKLYDLVICMGAGSAFGGPLETLKALKSITKEKGLILLDNGYWKKEPDKGYLDFLGIEAEVYGKYSRTIDDGLDLGLEFLYGRASSQDEWDHFEGLYLQSMMRYLNNNPDDPDYNEMKIRMENWRDAYYKWGRETLGYGIYLFMNK